MLRRKEHLFLAIMLMADIMMLAISFMLAYWLRSHFLDSTYGPIPAFTDYARTMWLVLSLFLIAFASCGLYRSDTYRRRSVVVRSVLVATAFGMLLVLGILYMMKQADISRGLLDIFALLCFAALPTEKLAVQGTLDRVAEYRRSRKRWQVLIIGEQDEARAYLQLLDAHPHWGVAVVGIMSPTHQVTLSAVGGGSERSVTVPASWRELLKGYIVDEVVAVSPWSKAVNLTEVREACVERGLVFRMLVLMPPAGVGRYTFEDAGAGNCLVSLETVPQEFLPLMMKRMMDVAGSVVGLVLCGLVYLWYAPRLQLESPGPVFFRQRRGGHNGRIFTVYKFRTMYLDAEERLPDLLPRNAVKGVMFKMQNDPRVVSCGRSLRRTHLDELPQFWNVLKGDMSLVGPRPNPAREVAAYGYHHYRRLSMKPGITGLFQINGHAAVNDFDEVTKLDCTYIDNWSLWLDCKIIMNTLRKMLQGNGW